MWLTGTLLALMFLPDYAAEGMKALEEQRYDAAIASFTKVAEADPKDYSAYFHIGLAQSLLNRDPEAIASYKKVLELKPELYEAQLNLGIVLLRSKQPAEAARYLEDAAKQKPKEFRPAYHAAIALLESGSPDRAIPYLRTAVEIDPNAKDAQAALAQTLARAGKLEEAAPLFEKSGNLLELGELYEKANRRAEAIEIYRKFPDNPAARERFGELLLEGGDAAKAIPELQVSVAKSPTSANRYALAMAYVKNNEYSKAEPLLQAAVEQEPKTSSYGMQLARVFRQQKKYAPAADNFLKVAQAKPDRADAWSELAGVLVLLERYEPALAALDRGEGAQRRKARPLLPPCNHSRQTPDA